MFSQASVNLVGVGGEGYPRGTAYPHSEATKPGGTHPAAMLSYYYYHTHLRNSTAEKLKKFYAHMPMVKWGIIDVCQFDDVFWEK